MEINKTDTLSIWNKNGVNKIKMSFKDAISGFLISLIFGFFFIWIIQMYTDRLISMRIVKYQTTKETQEQISLLRDSFEMEYYKKQLESYPLEHSKIKDGTTK